ncbi:amino acid adenylation domain-containing protein [Salinactinospora qingdaonensis]|uniref:Uncharacterized protein n=1 Tax=Salinactinospora qingdaonensis TaxID=702744 RepID=A0ABP7G5S6_9ACTN
MRSLVVPQLGEGIVEVRIVRLLKDPGDRVAKDEVIYEMEHDKAAVEIESPADGVLREWVVSEGDDVAVGDPVAVLDPVGEQPRIPPKTRRLAQELGIDREELETIPAAGRVLLPQDVQSYAARRESDGEDEAEAAQEEAAQAAEETEPEVHLSPRQLELNRAMRGASGQTVPATVAMPLDAELLDRAVAQAESEAATPFQEFARRVARVAADHPRLRWYRIDDERVRVHERVNLGIAVAAEGGDLTVAAVTGADQLSENGFAQQYAQAVEEAREGRSQADGSVSLIVSHLGEDAVTFAVPVVVPPAVATLFLGARDNDVRQMVLSFDHSLVNGEDAARFLAAIRDSFTPARPAAAAPAVGDPLTRVLDAAGRVLGHTVDPDRPLGEQGMDSAAAMRLVGAISDALDTEVPVSALWRHPRLRELVAEIHAAPSQASTAPTSGRDGDDVAIVGVSCTVPGADDVEAYWRLLERGECRITDVPPPRAAELGSGFRAALLERIDQFDAEFFGVTPRQAAAMDPQQRMLLELSRHALEHAGVEPETLSGTDVGVFVAACSYDYRERVVAQGTADGYATTGTFPAFLANRVSHFYDFTGPSITVDTACSGALTAVATAVAALRAGDCTTALVGSANLLSSGFNTAAFQQAGMLSPQGHSRVFDTAADGFVRGEGAGWVVLKPLRQAQADGDPVLAVLRGVAVNHGGRAASLTSPNPAAQTRLIRRALDQAGVDAASLGYLEAHGTGTALGDPIEIDGILGALAADNGEMPQRAQGPEGRLWVGSVKSNIGHLEGASGLIGLIKVVLSLHHGAIPASLGFTQLNSEIDLDGTPVAIADRTIAWPASDRPRVAAVSAFGFGGSNAHAVLQEPPASSPGRRSLPLYRFRRDSFWLTSNDRRLIDPGHPLADHAVAGTTVLAGACLVESLSSGNPLTLRRLRFLEPVHVDRFGAPVELTTVSEGEERSVLAAGTTCATAHSAAFEPLEPPELTQPQGGEPVDLYDLLSGRGIEVGPVYRLVNGLQRAGGSARAGVTAPESPDAYTRRVAWLDAVLQTSHAVVDGSAPYVAAGADELTWNGSAPDAEVRVRRVDSGATHPVVDIDVTGTLRVRGLRLAPAGPERHETPEPEGAASPRMLVPRWIPEPPPPAPAVGRGLLMVHDTASAAMATRRERVHIADPQLSESVSQACSQGAVDLWLLVGGASWTEDDAGIAQLRAWMSALVTVAQALAHSGTTATVRLVTTGLASPQGGAPQPGATLQGALLGALRSLPRELPSVTVCAVDLPDLEADATVAAEEPCGTAAPLVARHDRRWRQTLVAEPIRSEARAFRPGGRYVIFGGAGGIGSEIANHLATNYGADLLLVGRSSPDERIAGLLRDINGAGGRAAYRVADLTDSGEPAKALDECRETFGDPDGVVHAIGSVSAALVGDLTASDLDAVLATKVSAVVELRRLVGDRLLVLSSSVAGLFGSQGGLNYAAANGFLGHYAAAVDGAPATVRAIDWGLWRDTGLARKYAGHVLASYEGLSDFEPAQGVAALETAVAGSAPHVSVLAGEPSALAPHTGADTAHRLEEYARSAVHELMTRLGPIDPSAGVDDAAERLGVVAEHRRLLAAILDLLATAPSTEPPAHQRRRLLADYPDLAGHVELLDRVLDAYGAILRGTCRATDVLFPDGDFSLVSAVYRDNRLFDPANEAMAVAAAAETAKIAETGRRPRVLEIGAGVGGTTERVRRALPADVDYVYTDLSPAFLHHGQRRFGDAIDTALLDIEKDPLTQGFEAASFDLVLASNVVHATRDVKETLEHIGEVTVPGGRVLLAEMVAPAAVYTLIFGVTEGWWRHTDTERRIPHSPLLDTSAWRRLLTDIGWTLDVADDTARPGGVAVLDCTVPSPAGTRPPDSQRAPILGEIRDLVRELTRNPDAAVPGDATWQELGVDSLLNGELVAALSRRFMPLPSTALFEHATPEALAHHLAANLGTAPAAEEAPLQEPAADPVRAPREPTRGATEDPAPAQSRDAPVAVVGLAGRYPGAADVDEFWELLRTGRSPATEVPADRWDWRVARVLGGGYARWGCFLDDWNGFDAELFRISPREAAGMDPQERLFLEVAWEGFETAGYPRSAVAGRRVGVFAGVTATTHLLAGRDARASGADNQEYAVTALASVANRVSHTFDLSGPSMTVDTMCSSSLSALHLACRSLVDGDAEMALAGGVNLYLHPDRLAGLCALGMPSRGDRTRAFGAGADGFVPGEGVGVVVLKRLADAQADGDTVYAVIRGTATNHGGGAAGYTVPNPAAQAELVAGTLQQAGLAPGEVDYVEAHGTGTELGDPIELRALATAFAGAATVRVGSVKSNIGHGEAAAGIAGLTKAILQLHHGEFVPTLHADPVNPKLELDATPLRIQHTAEEWPAGDTPRRAAVSSFGAGGANAHVVIEEPPRQEEKSAGGTVTIPLSAPDPERLALTAQRLFNAMEGQRIAKVPKNLDDLAHTLHVGRELWPHRATITCATRDELAQALQALARGEAHPCLDSSDQGRQPPPPSRRVALPTTPFARPELPEPARGSGLPLVEEVRVPASRTASLDLSSSRLLTDHVVDGEPLLPGALHPELVYETLLSAGTSPYDVSISGLTWPESIAGTGRVDVRLNEEGDAFWVTASGRTAAEGTVSPRKDSRPDRYDVADLEARESDRVETAEFYRTFAAAGFDYGPSLQTVRAAWPYKDGIVARFALLEGEDPDGRQMLHPAVLDGACQAAAFLLLRDHRRSYRPLCIERLNLYRPATGQGYVHVRKVGEREFDLTLIGEDGTVLAEVVGFTVHIPTGTEATQPLPAYGLEWVSAPSRTVSHGPVAVLGEGPVAQAASGVALTEARDVLVDFTDVDEDLAFWAQEPTENTTPPVGTVFATMRELMRDRALDGTRVHVVTAAGTDPSPMLHGLHGLVRTISGETARFQIRLVTVDRERLAHPAALVDEIAGDADFHAPSWVRLGGPRRRVATLVPYGSAPASAAPLVDEGCYLLIGGLGGFGRAVAADILARAPRARVVLTGRSAPDPAALDALRALAPDATVEYHVCDATVDAQVRELSHALPEVRGIVYLAGVLRDGFLRAKTDDSVRAVCDAKIRGAVTVDAAFAHHRLDFFVLVSSLAALAGNQGQSDYAFANGFLDGFAAVRAGKVASGARSGHTLSVAMPILAEAGMSPAPESLDYLATTLGLTPLPAARAAAELWPWLGADYRRSYVALVHGDRRVWEEALDVAEAQPADSAPPTPDTKGRPGPVEWLREMVAQALGVPAERLAPEQDLAEQGVDSLALMRLNRAFETETGRRLPMSTLLDSATIVELADRIDADHAEEFGAVVDGREPGPAEHTDEKPRAQAPGVLPERLMGIWGADQAAAPAAPYMITMAWEVPQEVDTAALARAVTDLVSRHPVLGSVVAAVDGELRFAPAAVAPRLEVRRIDEAVEPRLRAEAERRFHLSEEPPLRAVLWLRERDCPVLQLVTHHLVVDGRSMELIRDDLEALYEGAALPETASFTDALDREHAVPAERIARCESFWSARLADASTAALFAENGENVDPHGAHRDYRLPRELSESVKATAAAAGVTPFVVMLAAFSLAVARFTGHRSFLVSVPTYGRPHEKFEGTVGCFVNSVLLRVRLAPERPVAEWLAELQEETSGALAHADLPYPRIQRHAAVPAVTFAFQNWRRRPHEGGLLGETVYRRGQQGHFDLGLEVTATGEGIDVLANHRPAALDSQDVDVLVDDLRRMAVELGRGGAATLDGLLDPTAGTLVGRVRDTVAERPAAVAVADGRRRLTYAELDELVRRVAANVSAAVPPGDPVAVLIERDARMPAVLLGVLAAGSPYVPLDAAYPPQRRRMVLEQAGCPIAVVADEHADSIPEGIARMRVEDLVAEAPVAGTAPVVRPHDLAYLMFTSGSTGRPKGVAVTHGNVVHTLDAISRVIGWTHQDRLLAVTTVCFDISVLEIFLPLLGGGTVVIADRATVIDAGRLARTLQREEITAMQATPAGWQLLVDGGWQGKPDLTALCGGEALPDALASTLIPKTRRLWNVYGPTEATIWSTIAAITADDPVHLGSPIGATDLVVTDEGELWIGGPAVAQGYWRSPELTAQRFGPHPTRPEAGGRYFRTGDLVRYDDAGRLLFVGRRDNQVKVRGHRVEPGEIESVLGSHPDIARVVIVLTGHGADARLVAVARPKAGGAPLTLAALREIAERRLPEWMVPDRLVVVDTLPLTPNGKVDREAVARLASEPPAPASPVASAAAVDVADTVASAWAEVLGLSDPPRDRSFFEEGGNSLLVGQLYARLVATFPDIALEAADLFSRPTVAAQAELINKRLGTAAPSRPSHVRPRSRRELRRALRLGETR